MFNAKHVPVYACDEGGRVFVWPTHLETDSPAVVQADADARTTIRIRHGQIVQDEGR